MRDPQAYDAANPSGLTQMDEGLFAKITWRLIPLLVVCYVVAFIDRINISYAQLGMKQTLPFDNAAYAIGAGLFFIGYLIFEIPSNLLLERIGVRKTLLRIMCCWGAVSLAMAFVKTEAQLYILRFLLGAFEAGFYPGIVLYLTYWYPADRRGRVFAAFSTAIVIAPIIAGPLSGAILKYCDGGFGLHGWQWLFILQGMPACLLGVMAFHVLADKPAQAGWLNEEEKQYLEHRLADPDPPVQGSRWPLIKRFLASPTVYMFALASILFSGASYTVIFSMPSLIESWGVKDPLMVGTYTIAPYFFAASGMILIGGSSDRWNERRWHFAVATCIAATGLLMAVWAQGHLVPSLAGLCIMGFGQGALLPLYTAIISNYVPRNVAAAGIALLSCVGHLGSASAPAIIAKITSAWGTPMVGLSAVAGLFLCAGLLILLALHRNAAGSRR